MTGWFVVALLGLFLASPVSGQSLADVAKREAERRATTSASGKSYTDHDLKRVAPGTASIVAPSAAGKSVAAAAEKTSAEGAKPAADADAKNAEQPFDDRGEDFWRQRATAVRSALESARADLRALDARADELHGAKGGAESRERDIVVAGQKRAKVNVASLEAEWGRLEKAAQDAKVPAAWIR